MSNLFRRLSSSRFKNSSEGRSERRSERKVQRRRFKKRQLLPRSGLIGAIALLPLWVNGIAIQELALTQSRGAALALTPDRYPSGDGTDAVTSETEALADAVVAEINRVRRDPVVYATWLDSQRQYYDGTALRLPGEPGVQTTEGVSALDDAIAHLRTQVPLPPLEIATGLEQAAQNQLETLSTLGYLTTTGADGSRPVDRVSRYGELTGRATELLGMGSQTAAGLVMQLVVDDGNRSRSSRTVLLRSHYQAVGVACGEIQGLPLCVLDFAEDYISGDSNSANSTNFVEALRQLEAPPQSDSSVEPAVESDEPESGEPESKTPAPVTVPSRPSPTGESETTTRRPDSRPDLPVADPPSTPVAHQALPDYWPNYLSELGYQVILETNRIRADPAAYADELEALRPHYQGNRFRVPDQRAEYITSEGWSAVAEAIAVLRNTPPLAPLRPRVGLTDGATDHAVDLVVSNLSGHIGSDGSRPSDRINRYGSFQGSMSENISYSSVADAAWHLRLLIIDDGVPSRSHRDAILNPDYAYTGAACEFDPIGDLICVITYAEGYRDAEISSEVGSRFSSEINRSGY